MAARKEAAKVRGIYEKVRGSGVWWIQYFDSDGRRRREKAGSKGIAKDLLSKRRNEVIIGRKMPESLRQRRATFSEIAKDALEHSKRHKLTHSDDKIRLKPLEETFGNRDAASLKALDFERWLNEEGDEREWMPATFNRYRSLLSMLYREAVKNGKVEENPLKHVKKRRENNARERYLTEEEEARLREQITTRYPQRMPEVDIAIHTGMRRTEQYEREWKDVDLERRVLNVPRSKHGEKRKVFLNDAAVNAFRTLWQFSKGQGKVFGHLYQSENTYGARRWFEKCVEEAKIEDFHWHDLRHTYASRLAMKGADIYTIKELLGHKTINTTMRYAHLASTHKLAAVQLLCDINSALNTQTATATATGQEASIQ